MTDYHHSKFGLIWSKESYGRGGNLPPPQVANVLNRPGEIGLNNCLIPYKTFKEVLSDVTLYDLKNQQFERFVVFLMYKSVPSLIIPPTNHLGIFSKGQIPQPLAQRKCETSTPVAEILC